MSKRNIFNRVPIRRIRRSSFDLSHKVLTTMEMGRLYPVGTPLMCIPGDKIKLGHQIVAHANPMNSPAFADVSIYFMDFFVAFRNLYKDEHLWERFIANEKLDNGDTPVLPRMNSTDQHGLSDSGNALKALYTNYDTLWDYFGFQTGCHPNGTSAPLDAPWRAYWQIWNEFIRDEKLQDAVDWNRDMTDSTASMSSAMPLIKPARVNYGRDYLTSAFLSPQQGDAVALPLSGYAPIVGDPYIYSAHTSRVQGAFIQENIANQLRFGSSGDTAQANTNLLTQIAGESVNVGMKDAPNNYAIIHTKEREKSSEIPYIGEDVSFNGGHALMADLSSASSYDINDLRLANANQRWKEINNLCGTRYTEFLRAQYGVAPRDERLQRPEYIGGTKAPLIVSQVLQTSNSDTETSPTGTKYGQAMIASADYSGTYRVKEHGLIMTVAFIRPKTLYQDGIAREWTPKTYLDFMNPLFCGLGEQAVKNGEVFAVDDEAENNKIWGYEAMYQEYRYKQDRVTGKMRSNITGDMKNSFDYWHLGRHFDSLPNLNGEFITCKPSSRIFTAQDTEVQYLCEIGQIIKAVRPLPYYAMPHL